MSHLLRNKAGKQKIRFKVFLHPHNGEQELGLEKCPLLGSTWDQNGCVKWSPGDICLHHKSAKGGFTTMYKKASSCTCLCIGAHPSFVFTFCVLNNAIKRKTYRVLRHCFQ